VQWFGKKIDITRFLGQVTLDDPTNLPAGCAAICRNIEFTLDTGNVTAATTRAGINLGIQGINQAPITGFEEFVYQPEFAGDTPSFERPVHFDALGALQYENPLGTGRSVQFPAVPGGFTPPAGVYMLGVSAFNKVWAAFSDLKKASQIPACIDPKALTVYPLGMKPFGWPWAANTPVLAGEMCTPPTANGNGHTYRALNPGITGAAPPNFPLGDSATVIDNGGPDQIEWEEYTMVVANRLPAPDAPLLALVPAVGTFPANQTVYVLLTLTNSMGETVAGVVASITTTAANQAVSVQIPALAALASWLGMLKPAYAISGVNVYEADVVAGNPAPVQSSYALSSSANPLGTAPVITATAVGVSPPTRNSARITPGRIPTPVIAPDITRDPAAGTFAAGLDVYTVQTYTNNVGETAAGPTSSVINTNLNDGVQVAVAVPEDDQGRALYDILQVGIYEADVATGTPAPPASAYRLVGYYSAGANPVITTTAVGVNPPASNGTGPGGAIQADTADGGVNASQGMRYVAAMFLNQNETVSGFSAASIVSTIVDEDGWELAVFKVAPGPANIKARLVAFTVANGTATGPFDWIGDINLLVPSENFVYPMTETVGDQKYTATAILDNVTTQAIFNFDDTFLMSENNVDDRLEVVAPPPCFRVDYLESVPALVLTGVDGINGGGLVSIATDPESFRGDLGPVVIAANGEVCYGFSDKYKGIIHAIRSASGYAVTPSTGAASGWNATRRWGGEGASQGVGACGPKAWAACSKFIMLVNQRGIYKYEEGDQNVMSKEIPPDWARVNWLCRETIECYIDEDTHQVLVAVPVNGARTPNLVVALSYLEGWQNPIHFSSFSQKEITQEAARRFSFQDIQANVIRRVKRTLPPGPGFVNGPDWNTMPSSSFAVSQLFFGSSGGDGGLHARTPGIFRDNGAGIDSVYRTMSQGLMQAVSKPEGFNLNACGNGILKAAFWMGRMRSDGSGAGARLGIQCRDIVLTPDLSSGITRKVPPKMNEFWSVEFRNNAVPDSWFSLKTLTVYVIPVTGGRGELDKAQ
jgi:hypothetical protein